tara:strand:- start:59 stop:709 length:651 start_codon:yes stop_codon:yes gene_type:complete
MIQFDNVTVKHSDLRGIYDISFDIESGKFVYLMGPTGAGKSTIIKSILRSIGIDSGKIIVDGTNVSELSNSQLPYYRRNIGMIFQDFKLLDDRTIFENISLPLQIIGLRKDDIEKKVNQVLNQIDLSKKYHNYPNELSGGEQQKVCVARALVKEPKIILADEPTGNLDPSASDDIIDLLEKQTQIGTTVIMATHNYPLIENRIKDFIEMNNGRVVV